MKIGEKYIGRCSVCKHVTECNVYAEPPHNNVNTEFVCDKCEEVDNEEEI